MQTYCKRCLCDKHKDTRKRKRKSGPENLAGCVAFADGEHVPISGDPALVSLGSSQMHCVDDSYHLQVCSLPRESDSFYCSSIERLLPVLCS